MFTLLYSLFKTGHVLPFVCDSIQTFLHGPQIRNESRNDELSLCLASRLCFSQTKQTDEYSKDTHFVKPVRSLQFIYIFIFSVDNTLFQLCRKPNEEKNFGNPH